MLGPLESGQRVGQAENEEHGDGYVQKRLPDEEVISVGTEVED